MVADGGQIDRGDDHRVEEGFPHRWRGASPALASAFRHRLADVDWSVRATDGFVRLEIPIVEQSVHARADELRVEGEPLWLPTHQLPDQVLGQVVVIEGVVLFVDGHQAAFGWG